jgi:hypothetical protein
LVVASHLKSASVADKDSTRLSSVKKKALANQELAPFVASASWRLRRSETHGATPYQSDNYLLDGTNRSPRCRAKWNAEGRLAQSRGIGFGVTVEASL